jgi:hypothetical protein
MHDIETFERMLPAFYRQPDNGKLHQLVLRVEVQGLVLTSEQLRSITRAVVEVPTPGAQRRELLARLRKADKRNVTALIERIDQ